MSTIEDFESAPVGATATSGVTGNRAMKMDDGERRWVTQNGACVGDEFMAQWGYMLDPSVPTTAREALDLAWELAHEVKPGQVIPEGTRYLENQGYGMKEYIAGFGIKITPDFVPLVRTFDPLPDPEPDWLDAPAVLARLDEWDRKERDVYIPAREGDGQWSRIGADWNFHWNELHDVTPLYPKEDA